MTSSQKETRRLQIVRGALRALNTTGLPFPSFDTIAGEAGVSRQLIRHYFTDPESLMIAVCDELADSYRTALMQGILQTEATQRLPMFLDFYFNFLAGKGLRKPEDDAVYDAMFSLATQSPAIRDNLHEQYGLLRHVIAHEVQVSHPDLPGKACREIGFLFVALMYGHWKMVATLGFSASLNRVTREAMDRIIESYCGRFDDPDSVEPGPNPAPPA